MSLGKSEKPPPPPPPPSLSLSPSKLNPQSEGAFAKLKKEELDLALKRLLSLNEKFRSIFYTCNTFLRPQLQDGPKCGLVALSIASTINENFVNVGDIFEEAASQGFTKNGEIFDASFLAFLAEKCCGFKANIIQGGLGSHLSCIIHCLLNKDLLLVPYDADYNHSPCCKKGFKAHWAVITGFAIIEEPNTENDSNKNDIVVINSEICSLCTCAENSSNATVNLDLGLYSRHGKILIGKKFSGEIGGHENFREGKIYLIALQGKSKYFGLWPFDDVCKSNDNLLHFSTSRDSASYVIPEGGPAEGLKGKAIILKRPAT